MLMSIDELEAEMLKLDPSARAHLAERLLESLETLSEEENTKLWTEEAERRDRAWDPAASQGRPASDVFGDARGRLE